MSTKLTLIFTSYFLDHVLVAAFIVSLIVYPIFLTTPPADLLIWNSVPLEEVIVGTLFGVLSSSVISLFLSGILLSLCSGDARPKLRHYTSMVFACFISILMSHSFFRIFSSRMLASISIPQFVGLLTLSTVIMIILISVKPFPKKILF